MSKTVGESEQLLRRAKELFGQQKFQESQAAFQKLIDLGIERSEGFYGVALIQLRLGDLKSAAIQFANCLALDPRNANAYYYMGEISERQNQPSVALSYFHKALENNPHHAGALKKLKSLAGGMPLQPALLDRAGASPANIAGSAEAQKSGVYELIRRDPSPLAQETLGLINSVSMSVKPRLSAYLGKILSRTLVSLLILAVTFDINHGHGLWLRVAQILAILFPLMVIIRARTTLISLAQGRLRISHGILGQQVDNIELYRVVNLVLRRSFLNRLTGDGALCRSSGTA